MPGIWIGFTSSTMKGDPFCPSSKKYCIVMIDQMPPASSFSYFLTMPVSISTPFVPRFERRAS